jgi:hypothetical protein
LEPPSTAQSTTAIAATTLVSAIDHRTTRAYCVDIDWLPED